MRRELAIEFSRVTEAAALAGYKWLGRGDKNIADGAAVAAMRHILNQIQIDGEIVIGEGEIDEAPMLYIGEKVGTGQGDAVDIAVDPIEGTRMTAMGQSNALAVLAVGWTRPAIAEDAGRDRARTFLMLRMVEALDLHDDKALELRNILRRTDERRAALGAAPLGGPEGDLEDMAARARWMGCLGYSAARIRRQRADGSRGSRGKQACRIQRARTTD